MIRTDLTNEEYHAHHALSSSDIKAAIKSLAHWKGAERKHSVALDLGTAFHELVLEPHENRVICGPENRRGNIWKEMEAEAKSEGNILLTESDYNQVTSMAKSCLSNPRIAKIVRHPDALIENSIFVTCPETGLELKTRPDAYLAESQVCLDLKSTVDAGPKRNEFEKQVFAWNYHIQAAFYAYCIRLSDLPITYFAFAATEKTPPYATGLHILSGDLMEYAHDKMMNVLRRIARAKEEESYPTDWPELNMIHLPEWMKHEDKE